MAIISNIAALIIFCIPMCACTTIVVRNAKVETYSHFGFASLKVIPDSEQASVVITNGIGFIFGLNSATFGYLSEILVTAPDSNSCRTFIFVKERSQIEDLKKTIQNEPKLFQVCIFEEGEPP